MLLLVLAISVSIQWSPQSSSSSSQTEELVKRKKKPKRKKKDKPKKKKKPKQKKEKQKSPEQIAKEKAVAKKKHDKQLARQDKMKQKLLEERNKKKDKLDKEREKAHAKYEGCDSTDVVRTSTDSLILAKYIKVYRSLGGICYIIHLQEMAELEKTSEGFYSVTIKPSSDPRAPANWQTYLYCPIGKPDGMVALVSPAGDTVQVCSYKGERKNGLMSFFKKGDGMFYQERYVNDEKVWVSDPAFGN